jgi:5-methylcytosine-specific restriction endonuclease McrBC regulatory subunit McrC
VEAKENIIGTPAPQAPAGLPNPFGGSRVPTVSAPSAASPIMRGASKKEDTVEEMERILEEIIREKWKEVQAELDRVNIWKNKMDSKISKIEETTAELKNRLDMIHVQTTEKVEEYGRSMEDAKIEMKAMEKVMSKLIPSLSENIKELREVVNESKSKTRKSKETD